VREVENAYKISATEPEGILGEGGRGLGVPGGIILKYILNMVRGYGQDSSGQDRVQWRDVISFHLFNDAFN
jgi:hypothetical protein